jgi:hypothetical protein
VPESFRAVEVFLARLESKIIEKIKQPKIAAHYSKMGYGIELAFENPKGTCVRVLSSVKLVADRSDPSRRVLHIRQSNRTPVMYSEKRFQQLWEKRSFSTDLELALQHPSQKQLKHSVTENLLLESEYTPIEKTQIKLL